MSTIFPRQLMKKHDDEHGGGHHGGNLQPHVYMKKVLAHDAVSHYAVSIIVKNVGGVILDEISEPEKQTIGDRSPSRNKEELLITVSYKDAPDHASIAPRKYDEFMVKIKPSHMQGMTRVRVHAKHVEDGQSHDGTSTAHVGDPDG